MSSLKCPCLVQAGAGYGPGHLAQRMHGKFSTRRAQIGRGCTHNLHLKILRSQGSRLHTSACTNPLLF